jgi:CRP-like cAMP-binding protein
MSVPIDVIKQVPIFKGLSDKELKTLANNFTERAFKAGQELTSEGQGAAGFFVIESGEAAVTVDGEVRRTLARGDYFGEVALIDGGLRTARRGGGGESWALVGRRVALPHHKLGLGGASAPPSMVDTLARRQSAFRGQN